MKVTNNKPDIAISKEIALAIIVDGKKVHSIESCNGLSIMGCNLTRESAISKIEKAQSIWLSDVFSSINHNVKVIYIEVDHDEGQNYLRHLYLECKD